MNSKNSSYVELSVEQRKVMTSALINAGVSVDQALSLAQLTLEHVVDVLPAKILAEELMKTLPTGLLPKWAEGKFRVIIVPDRGRAGVVSSASAGTSGRIGYRHSPRLKRYEWLHKGHSCVIERRSDGGWEATVDGAVIGTFDSHTKAVESIAGKLGIRGKISAVKFARMLQQERAETATEP